MNKVISNSELSKLKVYSYRELFNNTINNDTILIFEPNSFHHECTPGYVKYFLNLGYNVDILMYKVGIDSLALLPEYNKIKIFIFSDLKQILNNSNILASNIIKYNYILLQTTTHYEYEVFKKLNVFKISNSFFVFHNLNFVDELNCSRYYNEDRIWTLANFSKGLQINPHYFGKMKIKNKNEKTNFFLTSSEKRNYTNLIKSIEKLEKENLNYQIIVIGRSRSLNKYLIPRNILYRFLFLYSVKYNKLYDAIKKSDYIIIPLDPFSNYDKEYNKTKSSGSIQLAYGFLKPPLINQEYSDIYKLNNNNSFIYNNDNLFDVMKKAILLKNKEYKQLVINLEKCSREIFNFSLNNIKKAFNKTNSYI